MGIFTDAQLSVTVDWNGDVTERFNTYNELDIMLTCGITPVFISCKMSAPSVAAINEIKTLQNKRNEFVLLDVLLTLYITSEGILRGVIDQFVCGYCFDSS